MLGLGEVTDSKGRVAACDPEGHALWEPRGGPSASAGLVVLRKRVGKFPPRIPPEPNHDLPADSARQREWGVQELKTNLVSLGYRL